MGFIGELNRYAIGRAIRRDVKSVQLCRDLVDALNGAFMQFDFRNGPLRRRYDAIKYTLKKLETTLVQMLRQQCCYMQTLFDAETSINLSLVVRAVTDHRHWQCRYHFN